MSDHPIAKAKLHLFKEIDGDLYIARFSPFNNWPVFWRSTDLEEVKQMAEDFRKDVIEKHKVRDENNQKAGERLKKARTKKSETSNDSEVDVSLDDDFEDLLS